MYVCIYDHQIYQSMDQPGKVANPARGQLKTREMIISLSPPELCFRFQASEMCTHYFRKYEVRM